MATGDEKPSIASSYHKFKSDLNTVVLMYESNGLRKMVRELVSHLTAAYHDGGKMDGSGGEKKETDDEGNEEEMRRSKRSRANK